METSTIIFIAVLLIVFLILFIPIILFFISRLKGKITININNYNFSPGDTIEGTVNLKLRKPLQAKSLCVYLIGETIINNKKTLGKYNQYNKKKVFEFKQQIGGEQLYQRESIHNFQIKIPQNIIPQPTGDKSIDALIKLGQVLDEVTSGNFRTIEWFLISELEIPGINISKKIQVNIG